MPQAQTELEVGLSFASILFLLFLQVGGWVLKLKLMLTQPQTELELELGLSLAIGQERTGKERIGQDWTGKD